MKEGAAARSTRVGERKVLRKQAKKARIEHEVKCSLVPGEKNGEETALETAVC